MLNPYMILALVVLVIGAFGSGVYTGKEYEQGQQAQDEVLIAKVSEASQLAAAEVIAKNKPIHRHNQQVIEREVRIVPDYSRCVHSDGGLRAVNDALQNRRSEAPSGSSVPGANDAER